jgi:4-hydroxybenzoate polyprenyltransferase
MKKFQSYLSLVKFSHTIFAMPFAIIGYFLALYLTEASFSWFLFGKIILCMVFARNAAMGFNRYADRHIDAKNPRTAKRDIPAGNIRERAALAFVSVNALLFVTTTWFINPLTFYLSPIALLVILGYSITKKFTALCHLILGLGLSLAPIGAYLSVTGQFAIVPVLFSFVVLFWVSGFDIIYALQDEAFDKEEKLHSIPALLGKKRALQLSSVLHFLSAILVFAIGLYLSTHMLYWFGATLFAGLLIYQHSLITPVDLSRVNLAFFSTNGIASIAYAMITVLSLFL